MVGEVFDFLPPVNAINPFDLQIALSVDGVVVTLIAQRENLLPGKTVAGPTGIQFESTNCSGTPWVVFEKVSESSLLTPVTMIDNKLYVPDPEGVGQVVILRSILFFGTDCIEEMPSRPLFLTPHRLLIDLRAEFPPPYTLRGADGKHEGRKFDQ